MANDWVKLQAEFTKAHEKTGVKVADWCESKGLKYSSARRYIKARKAEVKVKTKLKSAAMAVNKNLGNFKHGGYSKYFAAEINNATNDTQLEDELDLCRARIHLVAATIEEIQRRLNNKEDPPSTEAASSLFESLFKADNALDKSIARVESITKTLSSIRIDDVNEEKIKVDTERLNQVSKATVINAKKSISQTRLVDLQVKAAEKAAGGTNKIDDYIDSITGNGLDTVVG